MKTKEQQNEYQKKWYANHKDEINFKRRQKRPTIKDKVNEQERKYYHSHKEEISLKRKNKLIQFRLTNPKKQKMGENHQSWKGGIVYDNGYKFIWVGHNHPRNRNGYVQEHILIMEKYLGRYLNYFGKGNPENEIVHHIDKNRSNNNLNNLQLMTLREHIILHHKLNREVILNGIKC